MAPRILLIEDNQANMDLACYLLEAAGFECDQARDGETGVNAARGRRPDLVMCDLQLPGMDGFAVLQALRGAPTLAGLPVIALTAYAMVGDRDRILAAGFDGYMSKPIEPERFAQQVAGWLGLRQPPRVRGVS